MWLPRPDCRRPALLLLAVLITPATAAEKTADTLVVGHIRPTVERDRRDEYFIEMLRLALDRTEADHGPYRLREAPVSMSQNRALHSLGEGRYIDVVWTMTSREREARLQPVRIPLLKGLLGVRVPVVRTGERDRFDEVKSLDHLGRLQAGQGRGWPDVGVLDANGIEVVTAGYSSLFPMLAARRFDFMPRGVTEVWAEQHFYEEHGLTPVWQVLLVYRAPIYFFVRPGDDRLAERLQEGLRRAIRDGSFDRLFKSFPGNREALHRLDRESHRRILLENPQLPPETPIDDEALWYTEVFGQ